MAIFICLKNRIWGRVLECFFDKCTIKPSESSKSERVKHLPYFKFRVINNSVDIHQNWQQSEFERRKLNIHCDWRKGEHERCSPRKALMMCNPKPSIIHKVFIFFFSGEYLKNDGSRVLVIVFLFFFF